MVHVAPWVWVAGCVAPAGMLTMLVRAVPATRRSDLTTSLVLRVGLVAVLAGYGVFVQNPGQAVPWIAPTIVVSVALSLLSLQPWAQADLAELTRTQMFRVMGWLFLAMLLTGDLPAAFAIPAGIGDIAVGLAAPSIARRLARGDRRGAVAFHVLGIVDMTVALATGFLAAPGPYRLFGGEASTAPMTVLPLILIPTVVVPTAIAIHFLALRRLTEPGAGRSTARLPRPVHA